MQYRKFGSGKEKVSALGFGMMRLPVLENDQAKVDLEKTKEMVHWAIDNGVNYIDTAYGYHQGESESITGKVLQDGYREKVNLATKCPTWLIECREDYDKYLQTQLDRMQTHRVDVYLLHALNKKRWQTMLETNVFDFLDKAKSDGRIRYAAFSFHDDVDTFKKIVDAYPWDLCQIQYNFMDEDYQAGTEGLKYAAKKGIGVIIMEPLRGGSLVKNVPEEVVKVWQRASVKRTPAEWGLRWVWNHPEVTVVLSGMGEMYQVIENVKTVRNALPRSMTPEELALFDEVKDIYKARQKVRCTGCEYCLPCPQGINIPGWFERFNNASVYGTMDRLSRRYDQIKEELGDPTACISCGNCEEACPQNLDIRDYLKEIHQVLKTGK